MRANEEEKEVPQVNKHEDNGRVRDLILAGVLGAMLVFSLMNRLSINRLQDRTQGVATMRDLTEWAEKFAAANPGATVPVPVHRDG